MVGLAEVLVIGGVLVFALGLGRLGSNMAIMKGRSRQGWFVACALMPLFTVLLAQLPPVSVAKGLVTECPTCRRFMMKHEPSCRH